MRLHILSDLHLEFGPTRVPVGDCDVVILAGDIHLGREGRQWIRRHFPTRPVIYVLGNHEFYRHSIPDLTETLIKETDGSNIHVLENKSVQIEGYTFLGCTLWTDFKLAGHQENSMRAAERIMSDYSVIMNSAEGRILRTQDTLKMHGESLSWLKTQLSICDPARTIVVTHHAPSKRSEAAFHANSPLSPAFASDLDWLLEPSGIPLWVHGHTHYNVDYKIGATRVLSNQHGYPGEPCAGFNPSLIVNV